MQQNVKGEKMTRQTSSKNSSYCRKYRWTSDKTSMNSQRVCICIFMHSHILNRLHFSLSRHPPDESGLCSGPPLPCLPEPVTLNFDTILVLYQLFQYHGKNKRTRHRMGFIFSSNKWFNEQPAHSAHTEKVTEHTEYPLQCFPQNDSVTGVGFVFYLHTLPYSTLNMVIVQQRAKWERKQLSRCRVMTESAQLKHRK